MTYSVDVLIPCYNEEKYIHQIIKAIVEQDYPKELVQFFFIDGQSKDKTVDIIQTYQQQYPNIHLLQNPNKIVPFAMNLGIAQSTADVIVRLDAHASYAKDYISYLVHHLYVLDADNVGCVWLTKTQIINKKTVAISKVLSNKFGVGDSHFRIGIKEPMQVDTVPCGCYKRETLLKLGGYNKLLVRNQDIELNKRLKQMGGKIILLPQAKFSYFARESYKKIASNNYQNGLWNILTVYITKNANSLSIRHFIPLTYLMSLLLPVLLAFVTGFYFIAFLALATFVVHTSLVTAISLKIKDNDTNLYYLVKTFVVLHYSYGFGSLVGLFKINKLFVNNSFYVDQSI